MMRIFVKLMLLGAIGVYSSCSVRERPIDYGSDECDYCRMIIMDHRYGSEVVTDKGRIYTFDAAECMIDFLTNMEDVRESARHLLITSYTNPDQLHDAAGATFLVSRNMPSPMGAYLTAFSDPDSAAVYRMQKGGTLYEWNELFEGFKEIKRNVLEGID